VVSVGPDRRALEEGPDGEAVRRDEVPHLQRPPLVIENTRQADERIRNLYVDPIRSDSNDRPALCR
jgi:hypothetical protein